MDTSEKEKLFERYKYILLGVIFERREDYNSGQKMMAGSLAMLVPLLLETHRRLAGDDLARIFVEGIEAEDFTRSAVLEILDEAMKAAFARLN